ncbi:MAG: carbamate kinase, partial [Marinobacter sp.]
ADALLLLTDVDAIYRDFGKDTATPIHELTLDEARQLDLPAGSMGPKMAAAASFAESGGGSGIGRLEDALAILERKAGTSVIWQ